jgi:hypothetical protein
MDKAKVHLRRRHRHQAVTSHVLVQRSGIPYELQRSVCKTCGRELEARAVRRAVAA